MFKTSCFGTINVAEVPFKDDPFERQSDTPISQAKEFCKLPRLLQTNSKLYINSVHDNLFSKSAIVQLLVSIKPS
jgi:hypothetical protein